MKGTLRLRNLDALVLFQVQPILAAKSSENLAAAAAEDSKKLGGGKGSSKDSKPEAPPRSKSAKSRQGFAK